jgi:hypothetical protein
MAVAGSVVYPTLQQIADLFRFRINDTFAGSTNTPGEGVIMPNSNPDLLTLMNASIQETYNDLRNVGDAELILDNYLLLGIPPVNSALGVGVPNPMTQVSLDYTGYFDGLMNSSQWSLPANANKIERIWERQSNTQDNFIPMQPAPFGLPGCNQVDRMRQWEMRQNAVWMPGCLLTVDLRIRCRIGFPAFANPATIDFTTTYVPLLASINAIVAKMQVGYAVRFAPDQYQLALSEDTRYMAKLRDSVVHQQQLTEYHRQAFGDEATVSFPAAWTEL